MIISSPEKKNTHFITYLGSTSRSFNFNMDISFEESHDDPNDTHESSSHIHYIQRLQKIREDCMTGKTRHHGMGLCLHMISAHQQISVCKQQHNATHTISQTRSSEIPDIRFFIKLLIKDYRILVIDQNYVYNRKLLNV